jgi:hypothetical protein
MEKLRLGETAGERLEGLTHVCFPVWIVPVRFT